jgi:hypothetical protein
MANIRLAHLRVIRFPKSASQAVGCAKGFINRNQVTTPTAAVDRRLSVALSGGYNPEHRTFRHRGFGGGRFRFARSRISRGQRQPQPSSATSRLCAAPSTWVPSCLMAARPVQNEEATSRLCFFYTSGILRTLFGNKRCLWNQSCNSIPRT